MSPSRPVLRAADIDPGAENAAGGKAAVVRLVRKEVIDAQAVID